jgi:hypothetical protein
MSAGVRNGRVEEAMGRGGGGWRILEGSTDIWVHNTQYDPLPFPPVGGYLKVHVILQGVSRIRQPSVCCVNIEKIYCSGYEALSNS